MRRTGAAATPATHVVRLIDRRTGLPLRSNGAAMQVYTSSPDVAAAEVLGGRDPEVWEVRVDRLATVEAGAGL